MGRKIIPNQSGANGLKSLEIVDPPIQPSDLSDNTVVYKGAVQSITLSDDTTRVGPPYDLKVERTIRITVVESDDGQGWQCSAIADANIDVRNLEEVLNAIERT
jgi:hypothetical protein